MGMHISNPWMDVRIQPASQPVRPLPSSSHHALLCDTGCGLFTHSREGQTDKQTVSLDSSLLDFVPLPCCSLITVWLNVLLEEETKVICVNYCGLFSATGRKVSTADVTHSISLTLHLMNWCITYDLWLMSWYYPVTGSLPSPTPKKNIGCGYVPLAVEKLDHCTV